VLIEAFEFASEAFSAFESHEYYFAEALFEDLCGHFAHLYALASGIIWHGFLLLGFSVN